MHTQKLVSALRQASKAIQAALNELEQAETSVSEDRQQYAGTCQACGLPISESDTLIRGVHQACYHSLFNQFVKTGKKTADELEAEGLLGPKAKSGRKKRELAGLAKLAQDRIDGKKKK